LSSFLADLRYALRQLRSHPGFTLVAVATLALGIGANTAIFSVVDAVLLKPLPLGDPERLVLLYHSYPKLDLERASVSPPGFAEYRQRARSFSSLSAYTSYQAPATLTGAGEPRRIHGLLASAEFFTTLGVLPALGRGFVRQDEESDQKVAVISQGLWQQAFGADLEVAAKGGTVRLDEVDYTVVGVMPAGFRYPDETDVWVPLTFTLAELGDDRRGTEYLEVVARLRPGVTPAAAKAEMASLSASIRQRLNLPFLATAGWHLRLDPLRERLVGDVRPALLVLLAAVGTVLLIACANLANLLLARAAARSREIALRNALGAGRGRVVRQLVTESLLLALLGGGLGLLLAAWGVGVLESIRPDQLPPSVHLEIDLRVLLFTLGLSLATGLLFGLAPALRAARGDPHTPLRTGGRWGRGLAGRRSGVRGFLVVAEVALALVLLAGAGLLLRSFARLTESQPGFATRGRLAFQVSLPASRYGEPARAAAFFLQLAERLASLPAVRAAGAVSTLPLAGISPTSSYRYESLPREPGDAGPHGCPRVVTPGYLRTMGIPLLRGRDFTTADRAGSVPVALIDEQAARRFFPASPSARG
jgi:putative ABC transport system permease protein